MKPPSPRREAFRELLATDLSYAEIGRRLGVSRSRVAEIARKEQYRDDLAERAAEDARRPILERRLEYLPLSTRTLNCFKELRPGSVYFGDTARRRFPTATIETVSDLLLWTEADLLLIYNFGRGCLAEVRACLASHELRLFAPPYIPPPTPPRVVYQKCPHCGGTGRRLTPESYADAILR